MKGMRRFNPRRCCENTRREGRDAMGMMADDHTTMTPSTRMRTQHVLKK